MKIGIIGLGLIGGSFAKTIAAKTRHKIAGFDKDERTLRKAYESGLIEQRRFEDVIDGDIILIALYPHAAASFIKENAKNIKQGAIVVDLCGVKRFVVDEIMPHAKHFTYIGGHPMAGTENSGFSASTGNLFDGASMILTPTDDISEQDSFYGEKLQTARNFFLSIGFKNITLTDPKRHDEMIAFTSQLAHIVSSAYAQNPFVDNFNGFSAGSFADMTRVAKLNEDMWTELFMLNADFLTEQLEILINNLVDFKTYLQNGETENLREILKKGRKIKENLC